MNLSSILRMIVPTVISYIAGIFMRKQATKMADQIREDAMKQQQQQQYGQYSETSVKQPELPKQ